MISPENNSGNNPEKKSFLDPVQDFAEKELNVAKERFQKRATEKKANKEKTRVLKSAKGTELWDEAMNIAKLRYPAPDGAPDWLTKKFESAQQKVAQEYLKQGLEVFDKKELGRINLAKEEGKNSAVFQEVRNRLWEMGLDVAKGEKSKQEVYRDQDNLILDSEKKGAEKWEGYIESWAAERKWRGNIRIPYLPKNWALWGKAELAAFDLFTGGWVKKMEKVGLQSSKARTIGIEPSLAIKSYDKKLRPEVVRDMEHPDEGLLMLGVAKIGKEYQIAVDIYRHAVLDEETHLVEQGLNHVFKYSLEDAEKLMSSDSKTFNLLRKKIFDLLIAHQEAHLAKKGLSLTSEEIKNRAQRLAATVVNRLRSIRDNEAGSSEQRKEA